MKIIKINKKNLDDAIAIAVDFLQKGYTVVYPTETSYGLGGDALRPDAARRIFKIKKRISAKALPVIVSDLAMLKQVAFLDKNKEDIIKKIYGLENSLNRLSQNRVFGLFNSLKMANLSPPRQGGNIKTRFSDSLFGHITTVILPKRNIIPFDLTAGKESVAVRITSHPIAQRIAIGLGKALIATSANISEEEPMFSAEEIARRFKREVIKPDLIIDVGDLPKSKPSTLLDLTSSCPRILRVGVASPEELLMLLKI